MHPLHQTASSSSSSPSEQQQQQQQRFSPLPKCFAPLHVPFAPYLLRLISIQLLAQPIPLHCLWAFFPSFLLSSFLSLSVILLGKVIKGRHIGGASLRRVILFSRAGPLFSLSYFCFAAVDLIGEGRRKPDKASWVLCSEIIWRPDNARRVSSFSFFILSSHLSPRRRTSPRRASGLSKHVYRVTLLAKCQVPPTYVLNPSPPRESCLSVNRATRCSFPSIFYVVDF